MRRLDQFLFLAVEKRASDLHLSAGESVRVRVDGSLLALENSELTPKDVETVLFEILSPQEREKFLVSKCLDKSYTAEGIGQFRVNLFVTRRGAAGTFRVIPSKVPTLEELVLPPVIKRFSELHKGLVLVTGPTGSGKSTTLAAMINHINTQFSDHILTVEDPVEFIHFSKKSLINQREIGASCNSFSDALRNALREDPDVILLGELRDLETMSLALSAAETGHLVLATLHTRGAGSSIDRIIDSFPSGQQAMIRTLLANSLMGVVSQTLLKRADGTGRVGAYEIMTVTPAIANLIREGKIFQIESIIQTGKKDGMILMDQSIQDLVSSGVVDLEEAIPFLSEARQERERQNLPKRGGTPLESKPSPAPAVSTPASAPRSKIELVGTSPAPVILKPLEAGAGENTRTSIDLVKVETIEGDDEGLIFEAIQEEKKTVPQTASVTVLKTSAKPATSATQPSSSKLPTPPPLKKKAGLI